MSGEQRPFTSDALPQVIYYKHGYRYVASSSKTVRNHNFYYDLERRSREMESLKGSRSSKQTTSKSEQSSQRRYQIRLTRMPGRYYGGTFYPATSKTVYFVLNGNPSQIHRCLLNPSKPLDLDVILEEVSHALGVAIFKIYTYEGERITSMERLLDLRDNRVIAVGRNEKLVLQGRSFSDLEKGSSRQLSNSLPPIYSTSAENGFTSRAQRPSLNYLSQQQNSIERPGKYRLPSTSAIAPTQSRKQYIAALANKGHPSADQARKRARRSLSQPRYVRNSEKLPLTTTRLSSKRDVNALQTRRSRNPDPPKRDRHVADAKAVTATAIASAAKAVHDSPTKDEKKEENQGDRLASRSHTADSDSGRPRSINHLQSSHNSSDTHENHTEQNYHTGHEGDDEIEEEGEDYDENEMDDMEDDYPEMPQEVYDHYMDNGGDGVLENRAGTGEDMQKMLKSVTAIQAGVRGFLTRKRLRDERKENEEKELDAEIGSDVENDDEKEEAAIHPDGPKSAGGDDEENVKDAHSLQATTADEEENKVDEDGFQSKPNTSSSKRKGSKQSLEKDDNKEDENHNEEKIDEPKEDDKDEEDHKPSTSQSKQEEKIEDKIEDTIDSNELDENPGTSKQAEDQKLPEIEEEPTKIEENGIEEKEKKDPDQRSDKYYFKLQDVNELEGANTDGSTEDEDDLLLKRSVDPGDVESYTVVVKLGNRWAADSETELFVQFFGEKGESEKVYIRNQYVNWLEVTDKEVNREMASTFRMKIKSAFVGILQRITIGHDSVGYGAGIFIDTIVVTENAVNGRGYLFQVYKWFDSGQVDGKLVRTVKLTAFCEMYTIPQAAQRTTRGRWEVVLRSGDHAGNGGTSSNLLLVGTGTMSSSTVVLPNEKSLQNVPSETMIQADFGPIGELLKLRVEIDGEGDQPNYCIQEVELRDLDTQEKCVIPCAKWLKWHHTQKGDQPFREFMTFKIGVEPLPLIHYEGKITVFDSCLHYVENIGRMELIGDLGQTGCIFIDFANVDRKSKKPEVTFKFEALSVGKLHSARFYLQPKPEAEPIYKGFDVLQQIWDRQAVNGVIPPHNIGTTGNYWLLGEMTVREGLHVPFKYSLNAARIRPRGTEEDPYVLELRLSALEGMPTRIRKSKAPHRSPSAWFLSMALSEHSNLMPTVALCGKNSVTEMHPISQTPIDRMISFQNKERRREALAALIKVRVTVQPNKFMKFPSDHKPDSTNPVLHIMKMRLVDNANGDEVRFPVANVIISPENGVVEFPVAWPDRPPLLNVVYEVQVKTGASSMPKDAIVMLNLFGEAGDTAGRRLKDSSNKTKNPFAADTTSSFAFEAVSIGLVRTAEITVSSKSREFLWECKQLTIKSSTNPSSYIFQFQKPFTAVTNRQAVSLYSIT
ncbi:unnamed protein product [Bursaphelenchus xylophilus]|uniref:(pine wood nematode) hypothetical protein n=1 Tax=Bursaphelenchus xylophilus TaxID=6326 RepID=A0A1I7RVT1_BURXY|nr:unnamed protein product [Bursaphelenchus xylophilus]CAG9082136.1 unnamed protein product [Bursaphelenchus xylophilus]